MTEELVDLLEELKIVDVLAGDFSVDVLDGLVEEGLRLLGHEVFGGGEELLDDCGECVERREVAEVLAVFLLDVAKTWKGKNFELSWDQADLN